MYKLIILFCIIILSSCTQTDQVKTQVLDKVVEVKNEINNKIDEKIIEEKSESATDEEMLNDIMVDDDSSLDADLKALETDLQ